MTGSRTIVAALAVVAAAAMSDASLAAKAAKAKLVDSNRKEVGLVSLLETAQGVLLKVQIRGLPEGQHGFHIHETGKCEPPFESAGGHFNPGGGQHGFFESDGMHAGDLPNLHASGTPQQFELLVRNVTLLREKKHSLMDDDGAAIVVHQNRDDYRSDPAGNAGDRIACGVIEATELTPEEAP